ncbi:MAG: Gfo/Idh/MocA family oxidoreductase [Eubacteriales bacterium]|nr:Gfo/Idh/MocA family oxidoreductase [Eubacteriales bacterium]
MLRIGSVGTSAIMRLIQEGIRLTEGMGCTALYSRDEERGRAFASAVDVPAVFTSYEEMTASRGLDVIYIASPNALHCAQAMRAVQCGKHVIVEKPLATTRREAETLMNAARENGVFVFEAITTLFMPSYLSCRALLGRIGAIREAELCYAKVSSQYAAYLRGENPNIFNPDMQGGALNDMGVYGVHAAVDLFGAPQAVAYKAERGDRGVDLSGVLTLRYPGFVCHVTTAKNADLGSGCRIEGENGWIRQTGELNAFADCSAEIGGAAQPVEQNHSANRMVYELARFRDAILSHDTVFFERMSAQSIEVASILERAAQK